MFIMRFITIAFIFVKFVESSKNEQSEKQFTDIEKSLAENYVSVPVSVVYEETNITNIVKNASDLPMAVTHKNLDNDGNFTHSSNLEVSKNKDNVIPKTSSKPEIQSSENTNISSSIKSDVELHIPVKIIYDSLPESHNKSDISIDNNKNKTYAINDSNDEISTDYDIMQDATNTKEKSIKNDTSNNDDIELKSNPNISKIALHMEKLPKAGISSISQENQDIKSTNDKVIKENITESKNSSKPISNQSTTEDNKQTMESNQSVTEDNMHVLTRHETNKSLDMSRNEKPEKPTQPENNTRASINRPSTRQQRRQRVNAENQKNRIRDNVAVNTKPNNNISHSSEEPVTKPRKGTRQRGPVVPIVQSENYVFSHSGDFHYSYESGDGTKAFEKGQLRNIDDNTGEAVVGSFSYIGKDGKDYSISYTADENGYRPVGDHLPTPPPIPPAIARALKYLATKTTPEPVTESTKKHHASKGE